MESPYRSHLFRSEFQVPPKSYHPPMLIAGRRSFCKFAVWDSLLLFKVAWRKNRSSNAFASIPALVWKLSSSASKNHSLMPYCTNCWFAAPSTSSKEKNGFIFPTTNDTVGPYFVDPSGQSQ